MRKAIIVPNGLRLTPRGNHVAMSTVEDTFFQNLKTMLSQHATSARINFLLVGFARAVRGNRQAMRAVDGALFGNLSRVRGHLESCGGYDVLCSGDFAAMCGSPDAWRGNVGMRFGFARPTDGLAEPFCGVTGAMGGISASMWGMAYTKAIRRNRPFRQNCLTRRAVLNFRRYTAAWLS